MKVREIMTKDVECAELDSTLEEIATMMKEDNVGAVPVVDDNELLGIITDRDIVVRCVAEGKDPSELTAEEILSEDLCTVTPDTDVEDASRMMAERQIRRLPVVQDGKLMGMISLGDIAGKHDEHDLAGETLERISEGVKHETSPARPSAGMGSERTGEVGRQIQTGGRRQGLSSQEAGREPARQERVVPIRGEQRKPASRTSSKRKAG